MRTYGLKLPMRWVYSAWYPLNLRSLEPSQTRMTTRATTLPKRSVGWETYMGLLTFSQIRTTGAGLELHKSLVNWATRRLYLP